MGRIYYIIGKSSSGKDTIYRRLLAEKKSGLTAVIPYTTRPMREGEQNGKEYFFTDSEGLEALRQTGKVIEERVYMTYYGPWHYFTVDDGQLAGEGSYLGIGTLESFLAVRNYYGRDRVIPLYIELDDGERLQRALNRERSQKEPKYEEMCRRFLADAEDFSAERIAAAGITRRFYNGDLEKCLQEIGRFLEETDCEGKR